MASSLGFEFALAVSLGSLLGYFLDSFLGWRPIAFTILFGLCGAVAGFYLMVKTLEGFERRNQGEGPSAQHRSVRDKDSAD